MTEHADQSFTITPDEGYQVEEVLVDSVSVGALTTYVFEDVRADHTIQVSFQASPGTNESYFGFDEYGGTWQDAEKELDNPDDDWMCWAAAAANILDWADWNVFDSAQDAFYTFQNYWTDAVGLMEYGWNCGGLMVQNQPPRITHQWLMWLAAEATGRAMSLRSTFTTPGPGTTDRG